MSLELPLADRVAADMVERLRPYCTRIEIGGSIRRRRPVVKDVEIVAIPDIVREPAAQTAMFADAQEHVERSRLDAFLEAQRPEWEFTKNGPHYKAFHFERSDLPVEVDGIVDYPEAPLVVAVDLFLVIPPRAQWGLIYMIRTGSGVGPGGDAMRGFGPGMLARWKRVSGGGYSKHGTLHYRDGSHHDTPTEADVFAACHMTEVAPELRADVRVIDAHAIR